MNILHIVNIYFVIPYFLGDQLLYFHQKGYQEHIICSPSKELELYSISHHFKYKEIPILRSISIWKDIIAVINICKYIHQNKIDIATGHTPKGGLVAMIASYIMRVRIRIYFRHGLVYETSKGLKRYLLISMDRLAALLATKVICVSPSVYKKSLSDKLNTEKKQILLSKGTCNGIDINKFYLQHIENSTIHELKKQIGIKQDDFVIGYVGRLVKDKGITELIDAFKSIQKSYQNTKLLLVGMLEKRDALPIEITKEIQCNPSIICTGYVNNQMIQNYYGLMSLFVLLSYREGFPTSVLEASSMELPVITTKATGCIDSIIEGKTGVFVSHNKDCIINAIKNYIESKQLCLQHGKFGREFVENNFEQSIIWEEIEKLYQ